MRQISKEQKENQGTYEPSKEGVEPVEYDSYERIPPAPDDWPPNIKKLWEDRCADLRRTGYLVKAFLVPLKRYCFAVYQAERAEKMLIAHGFIVEEEGTKGQTYTVPSKWLTVLDNANKTIEKFGSKFGFTPLDVQKIPVITKKISAEENLLK